MYDEQDALRFIRSKAVEAQTMSDDDLLEIINLIFDCYEENGELELDFNDDDETDDLTVEMQEESIAEYVRAKLDESIDKSIIDKVVTAELDYEASLL